MRFTECKSPAAARTTFSVISCLADTDQHVLTPSLVLLSHSYGGFLGARVMLGENSFYTLCVL